MEIGLWNCGPRGEQECGAIYVGLGRPDLDVEKTFNHCSPGFWGLETSTGTFHHGGSSTQWKGMQIFRDGSRRGSDMDHTGDKIGLLLDGEAGTLTVYSTQYYPNMFNLRRLGMVAGAAAGEAGDLCLPRLTGELCWAVAMYNKGDSVRLTAKPPPQ